jgi:uncharacterized protein YndB with AHSA1/START domain
MATLHIDLERTLRAPRAVVWSFLTTVTEFSRWIEELEEATSDRGVTLATDTGIDFSFRDGTRVCGTVTACRSEELLAIEARLSRGHMALDRLRLEPVAGGTRLVLTSEHTTDVDLFKPKTHLAGLFAVPYRLPFSLLREPPKTGLFRAYERSLDNLASHVEAIVGVPYRH